MQKQLTVILPVYYTIERKTKKDSTHLIGANWLRNVHFHVKNKVKQHLQQIVYEQIKSNDYKFTNPYQVTYKYYYKNRGSDLMNVVSASSKSFLDALQELNVVDDDTVQFCVKEIAEVAGQDKTNPRVEITITEVSDD